MACPLGAALLLLLLVLFARLRCLLVSARLPVAEGGPVPTKAGCVCCCLCSLLRAVRLLGSVVVVVVVVMFVVGHLLPGCLGCRW